MALIDEYIRQIRNAIYGKDVRAAIANGIQQCYTDVSDSVDRANTAAANADAKANLANSKAAAADAAASTAYQNASSANTAAINANSAAAKLNGMTAAATLLPSGSSPTAQVSEVSGHKHISFGIPKGDKGDTGAKGKDFHIAKTFASIAEMNAYTGSVSLYDYAMIDTGNVEDADTGKLFCYEEDEKWHYIGDLSGAQGIKGETGTGISSVVLNDNYTLTINYTDGRSVTTASIRGDTGATGKGISDIRINDDNSVTILLDDGSEYTTEPVLGPQGETGPQGERGPQGESGPGIERVQMNSDYTLTIFLANGTDYTTPFAIQGSKGETGTGVDHISLNSDYTLTIFFTDGTSTTTAPIRGEKGDDGNGITAINMNSDYTLTITLGNGSQYTTDPIRGETGATGNGVSSVALNADYTLTITFTDGTSYVTQSIRGAQGPTGRTPNFTIGTVSTLEPGQSATASIGGTAENPVLNLGIPQGQPGATPVMAGATSETAGASGMVPAPAAGDNEKFLRGDATFAIPGVLKINGRKPDPVTGDITVIEGGGSSSFGCYRLDAVIPVSAWTGDGPYVATVSNELITANMDGTNTWLDDENVVLGDTDLVTSEGLLTITTTVIPTESWSLHVLLAVNGADVLADVSRIRDDVDALQTDAEQSRKNMAIVAIGNTHEAIPAGQFVDVKGHSTLADGVYWNKTSSAIGVNESLSTSNLELATSGGLNALKEELTSLNSNKKNVQTAVSNPTASGTATAFVSGITQNAQGVISPTRASVPTASTSVAGLVQLNNTLTSSSTSQALTAAQGKALNDKINTNQYKTVAKSVNTQGATDGFANSEDYNLTCFIAKAGGSGNPTSSGSWFILQAGSGSFGWQLAIQADSNKLYTRRKYTGNWEAWVEH